MGRVFATIDDELELKFRVLVTAKYPNERGAIRKCYAEAIDCWIQQNKHLLPKFNS